MSPALRTSRTLRARLAKRKAPRAARTVDLVRSGLRIDDSVLPWYTGTDVDVTVYPGAKPLSVVTFSVLAESFRVIDPPRRANLTIRYE